MINIRPQTRLFPAGFAMLLALGKMPWPTRAHWFGRILVRAHSFPKSVKATYEGTPKSSLDTALLPMQTRIMTLALIRSLAIANGAGVDVYYQWHRRWNRYRFPVGLD
jgi:hypothetical protein